MVSYVIANPKHQNILIALISAGAFIANLDATIVNITLPTLSREFSVSPGTVSWTVLAYLLCEAGFMLPMGKLADIRGIKKIYFIGFAVFLLGSLACGLAGSIGELIAFRAFQGIGGAMLFTVMISFIPIYLPPARRVSAMGLTTTAAAAGVGFGPPLGGVIASFLGWRWIFFVNIPLCLAALYGVYRFIPNASPRQEDRRFDFTGAVCLFVTLVLFLYAVNTGREWGWHSPVILSCFALAVVAALLFFIREKNIDYPLIDLNLFRDRVLLLGLIALSTSLMTVGGVLFIFPFYLIEYRGLDAQAAGFVMILLSLGQFAGPFTGTLAGRFGSSRVCLIGLGLGLISFLLFSRLDAASSLGFICLALGLFGLSQGIGKAPNASIIMACAPPTGKNAVGSLVSLCRSVSIALGILFFETIFSDSIPHSISVENTHIAAGISQINELAPGFHNAFGLGTIISLIAIVMMFVIGKKAKE